MKCEHSVFWSWKEKEYRFDIYKVEWVKIDQLDKYLDWGETTKLIQKLLTPNLY
ncbi:MAG: hypothetical protein Fur003_6090 [Candidatus Dojkabacteria bacterium]